jgi:hypothetical protein
MQEAMASRAVIEQAKGLLIVNVVAPQRRPSTSSSGFPSNRIGNFAPSRKR